MVRVDGTCHALRVLDVDLAGGAPAVAAGDARDRVPGAALVVDEARARPGVAHIVGEEDRLCLGVVGAPEAKLEAAARAARVGERDTLADVGGALVVAEREADAGLGADLGPGGRRGLACEICWNVESAQVEVCSAMAHSTPSRWSGHITSRASGPGAS